MHSSFHLEGYVYHMMHFETLKNVLRTRSFLSKKGVFAKNFATRSIANGEVQGLRDRVYIRDMSKSEWRSLHSYVPFYFAERTPMLYKQYKEGLQDEIVFLEVNRSIINNLGVLFTDGNAAIQRLAKFKTKYVLITPATLVQPACERRHFPPDSQGENRAYSDVYSGANFLEKLNWEGIMDHNWGGDQEKKRIKHAEVLVPDMVPLAKIECISTLTPEKANEVNVLIKQCGLEGCIAKASSRPALYF